MEAANIRLRLPFFQKRLRRIEIGDSVLKPLAEGHYPSGLPFAVIDCIQKNRRSSTGNYGIYIGGEIILYRGNRIQPNNLSAGAAPARSDQLKDQLSNSSSPSKTKQISLTPLTFLQSKVSSFI